MAQRRQHLQPLTRLPNYFILLRDVQHVSVLILDQQGNSRRERLPYGKGEKGSYYNSVCLHVILEGFSSFLKTITLFVLDMF